MARKKDKQAQKIKKAATEEKALAAARTAAASEGKDPTKTG